MLQLVFDANILIDFEDGGLVSAIFRLSYEFIVPDLLFELELREKHLHYLEAGLSLKCLASDSVKEIESLNKKYPRLSSLDLAALMLAKQEGCPLLTGDKSLRTAARKEGVEVHGTLWLMEELLKRNLIERAQAKESFDLMRAQGSRLPWGEVEKLLNESELTPCL